jgi:MarR family transcriptional regulator, transcriptional regulator for hemolysin
MENLDEVIFYKIEKTIKSYRQLAQQKLRQAGLHITVDQWLTLNLLHESPGNSQKELAEKVFKDKASITRIITLLVKAGYLQRDEHASDQRRSSLWITSAGDVLLKKAARIVRGYRATALNGIPVRDLGVASRTLESITRNCNEKKHH